MRLIDADKLKECFSEDTFKNRMVKVIIDRQPTVEVEKENEGNDTPTKHIRQR